MSRRTRAISFVCVAAAVAFAALLGQACLMRELSWTHREPPGDALIGFNFSCDQAEYLLLEDPALGAAGYVSDDRPGRAAWCAGVLDQLLELTGARAVRLSAQWDEVEPHPGEYDFRLLDALVASAGARGATVSLSVGMKAQRHPEYFIPSWAVEGIELEPGSVASDNPELREAVLEMERAVVQHFASSPVIDSWGAENEPYIASHRSDQLTLDSGYVAELVALIHANDPMHRPVVINHAQHFVMDKRWKRALADADVLGQSMYPSRNLSLFGVDFRADIMQLGPFMPNYAAQREDAEADGKQFWVTELQAEPWTDGDSRLLGPDSPSPNLHPEDLVRNLDYARRTGAQRIYIWGVEWWFYEAELKGDGRWLMAGAALFGPSPG